MAAPFAGQLLACATAASARRKSPPSEKESGVTLTMPMTSGRMSAPPRAPVAQQLREIAADITAGFGRARARCELPWGDS